MSRWRPAIMPLLFACSVTVAQAQVPKLAILGDSLSDEYMEQVGQTGPLGVSLDYSYAKNWAEQLHEAGIFDLGPTALEAGQSGGTWGEPRRTGYKYNFARYGARTRDMLDPPDGMGLSNAMASVSGEGIQHMIAAIGANDFFPHSLTTIDPVTGTYEAYGAIYHGLATEEQINAGVAMNIATAREALEQARAVGPAGGRFVLANLPDYGMAPYTWGLAGYDNPEQRERVTDVIRVVNTEMANLATEFQVPLVDIFGFSKAVLGENGEVGNPETYTIQFGSVDVYPLAVDNEDGSNPFAGFVHDGIHPNTVMQGAFANLFLEAFNSLGDDFTLMSEAQILSNAGIAGGGANTLFDQPPLADFSGYSDFVILPDPVPEPSTLALAILAVATLAAWSFRPRIRS